MDIDKKQFDRITVLSQLKHWQDGFELESDWGGERYYVSKETFSQTEDEEAPKGTLDNYDFKIVIQTQSSDEYDMEFEDGKNRVFYSVYMVPVPEHLSQEHRNSVYSCSGMDPDEDTLAYADIVSYGIGVLLANDAVIMDDECEVTDDALDLAATCSVPINPAFDDRFRMAGIVEQTNVPIVNLRGFFLDMYQNRIGNTGWDYLADYVADEDSTRKALDRWEAERQVDENKAE